MTTNGVMTLIMAALRSRCGHYIFPKFHQNPFTSGEVIAERVNIVETSHKVFPILGEASLPSKKC